MSHAVSITENRISWAPLSAIVVCLTQVSIALTVMREPPLQTAVVLFALVALTILASVLIVRAEFSTETKAVLLSAGTLSLLGVVMVQDVFGMRAGEARIAVAIRADTPAEPPLAAPAALPARRVRIDAGEGSAAATLAASVGDAIGDGGGIDPVPVDLRIEAEEEEGGHPVFRMTWRIGVGEAQRWCGQAVVRDLPAAEAARRFAELIARARLLSGTGEARCE